jgi:glycosyltransferase involved in cell wall biosynthesis
VRIAIVFAKQYSTTGGGFTFVNELLQAFEDTGIQRRGLSAAFLCDFQDLERYKKLYPRLDLRGYDSGRVRDKLTSHVRSAFPAVRLFWRFKTSLERTLAFHQSDFVWFLEGQGHVIQIPYLATIWDLQHRTHPWFPEVSCDDVWGRRENKYNQYIKRATYILVGTEVGRKQVAHFYSVMPEKIFVVPHFAPKFNLATQDNSFKSFANNINIKKPYLLYPANFWPHKNHIYLIDMLSLLSECGDEETSIVLVGEDKGNLNYVKTIVDKLMLTQRVHFLGFVERSLLSQLYLHAEALVYPSFSGPENLPPLEAFLHKCPVLYSMFPGAYEQLDDGVLYFNPCDARSGLEALCSLRTDGQLRKKLIQRGLEIVESRSALGFINKVLLKVSEFGPICKSWSAKK